MVAPFGRPIVYGGAAECPHRRRVLGVFRYFDGSRHVADWCIACGARSAAISSRDLRAAGIEPALIPVARDNFEGAA